jgi:hypothetical protein
MILLAAALVIPNILVATARADATYSGTLQASLTVSGFLNAERDPISRPAGLTFTIETFFMPDSFTEGDASADVDGAFGVTVGDPFDLDTGDRIDFDGAVSGTATYPTGSSFSTFAGFGNVFVDNASPDPVTISFDVEYDYAVSASVDNPALEYAVALAGFGVITDLQLSAPEPGEGAVEGWFLSEGFLSVLYPVAEYNDRHVETGTASFEVTLSAGQVGTMSISSFVAGDPPAGAVPEPTSWMLRALAAALLVGAGRRRRSSDG